MEKNKRFAPAIILLAIGILLVILPTILLNMYNWYQIVILIRLLRGLPFVGLIFCFLSWKQFQKQIDISRKLVFFGELYVMAWFFIVNIVLIGYSWDTGFMAFQALFFTVIISTSDFIKIRKKAFILFLLASCFVSVVLSYFAYPFYDTSQGGLWYGLSLMPNLLISSFYVLVFTSSLLSLIFAYILMTYIDVLMMEFLGRPTLRISAPKSIAVHLQIIPIVLSPLAILQIVGKTEFLEPTTLMLFSLCYSKLISVILCPILAFLGKGIFSMKFLGVTTIWSLVSFVQNLLIVFYFVASNVANGSYAFTMIVACLFAITFGITSSRISINIK